MLVFDPVLPVGEGPDPFSMEQWNHFEAAVSLAATIAVEWRSDRGGRLIAADRRAGRLGAGRPLRSPSRPARCWNSWRWSNRCRPRAADGTLLERLTAMPCAAVVVVGPGPGRLADVLRMALRRPVVSLNAANLRGLDFYEPPEESPLPGDHS